MAYVNYYLTQRVKITLPNIAACGRGGDKRKSLLKAGVFIDPVRRDLLFFFVSSYSYPLFPTRAAIAAARIRPIGAISPVWGLGAADSCSESSEPSVSSSD